MKVNIFIYLPTKNYKHILKHCKNGDKHKQKTNSLRREHYHTDLTRKKSTVYKMIHRENLIGKKKASPYA